MQGGGRARGGGRFARIDGEVNATVYGVVIFVGGRGLTGKLPPPPG